MSEFFIVFLILCLLLYALFKRVDIYEAFVVGAKKSLELVRDIFPFMVAIFILVELFRQSGLALILAQVLSPIFVTLGIPEELIELTLLRPFTGSGSLAILSDIYKNYGTDSYIGRVASVIMGSSETVFYVAAVYFSKTSVKKLGYGLAAALICNLVGVIFACLVCKVM